MKKSTLAFLLKSFMVVALLIGSSMSAQTFVKRYDQVIKVDRINNETGKLEPEALSVIFSGNDKGDIVFHYDSGKALRFYKIGTILEGASKDKFKYRYITTVDEDGNKVIMQLFDNGIFRVHYQDYTLQYTEKKD
jgi:hypothetical protein